MSIVSKILTKVVGEKLGDVNLLKDVLGSNYQPISDILKGAKITTTALDLTEEEVVKILGATDGALLVADLKAGFIPEAHLLIYTQVLLTKGLDAVHLTSLKPAVDALFSTIEASI